MAWRGPLLKATVPYADRLIGGLRPVTRADLDGVAPIRDDLLIYEYTLDPLGSLWGANRSRGPGPAPSPS